MKKEWLKNNVKIDFEKNIYAVNGLKSGGYDKRALFYDKVMRYPLYNLLMWGNHPDNYTIYAKNSIDQCGQGLVLDVGCGSLSFTHTVYNNFTRRDLVLSDLSEEMLKIGQGRIGQNQENVKLLRADALNFPFKSKTVQTILCFGFLHVINNPESLLKEFYRLLKPGGDLHITCLCTDRKISRIYLQFLKSRNIVSFCMNSGQIKNLIEKSGFTTNMKVIGGMAYVDAVKK